jgi:uncharacterized protein DUF397
VDVVPDDLKDPSVVCCDHGVAAIIHFHRGEAAAARQHLDVAAPYSERIGDRVVGPLVHARSIAFEQAGAPDRALAALTAGLTREDEVEDLLGDAARLAVAIGDAGTTNECVEVAELGDGAVAVRDSNNPNRPDLRFTASEWAAFVDGVRDDEF